MKVLKTFCDPPEGWKYGFPKEVPDMYTKAEDFRPWLISQGYPEKLIDSYGQYFFVRYWQEEVEK